MTNYLKISKSEEKHNESLPFFLLWVYSMGIMKNTNTTTYIKDDRISMQMQQSHWKNDAEYVALVEDLIYHEELLHMETITHHHFTNRLEHSIRVSYKSYQLAKKWKLDARATARAGLLHDFFHEDRDAVAQLNLGSHADAHPKIACENACRITEISSLERDIILKHMFLVSRCGLPRYKESFVVTYVDKYVAIREVVEPIKEIAGARLRGLVSKLSPVNLNINI